MAEFRTIIAVALTAQEVPVLLTWTEGTAGGTPGPLQQYVKLAGASEPVLEGGSSRVRYQLQLSAADPRAYSTTLTTATGATFGTSGLTLFTNSGNRPTPALIRIYPSNTGNLTSALVTNLGAPGGPYPVGQIQCTSDAIAAGSGNYLEIDLATRSATLVTSGITRTPRNDMINSASTRWFEGFEPGVSTLGCSGSGSTTNARVDVLGRSAYA